MDSDFAPHPAAEDRLLRRRFGWALALSLVFHAGLTIAFQFKRLEQFASAETETLRLVSRVQFKGGHATFPAKTFEDETRATPRPTPPAPKPSVPIIEKPSAQLPEKVTLSPKVQEKTPDLARQLALEKPSLNPSDTLREAESRALNPESNRDIQTALNANPSAAANPAAGIPIPTSRNGQFAAAGGNASGFSNLDELLERSGPLSGPVAPLNMPGGALFEYDSAVLLPQAIETLRKIGVLIERNPRASFSIEGHTDSFGTPAYNLQLSLNRARAVKQWLVVQMHIDPARIETRGLGSSHLLAPASGSQKNQAINRRVEIVIRTPKP
jgi:outer membrane protein OmpA-like peptidoglycan-associated protein